MGAIISVIIGWIAIAYFFDSFILPSVIAIILIIFFLFMGNKKNHSNINITKNNLVDNKEIDYSEDDYFDEYEIFDNTYSHSADSLMAKYEKACDNIQEKFNYMFDLKQRIKMLEKAIQYFEQWKDFCYDKGVAGKTYFNENYDTYSKNTYAPIERDFDSDYIFEFENAEFCNIDFLKSLLTEYTTNPEESKKHLLNEYIYYCGGPEEYEFIQKVQALPRELLEIIKKTMVFYKKTYIHYMMSVSKSIFKKL